jgi:protein-tyrosine phosphatase
MTPVSFLGQHWPFDSVVRHTRPVLPALDIARSHSLDRKADMFITTEAPDATAPNRFLDLDGPLNFRDLGGYPVGRDRFVRTRLLFRSDGLDTLTPADAQLLMDVFDLSTVVDLRSEAELARTGPSLLEQGGVAVHHLPIVDRTQQFFGDGDQRISAAYLKMIADADGRFAAAVQLLADLAGPAVFHCAAGKDRTGLLAAFVLDLLGVDDDLIADDYALTAAIMPAFRQRMERRMANEPELRKRMEESGRTPEGLDEMLSARASTIHLALTALRAEYGSVENWLLQKGLSPSAPDQLRNRLIV